MSPGLERNFFSQHAQGLLTHFAAVMDHELLQAWKLGRGGLWQVLNRPFIATVAGSVILVLVVVVFNAS